MLTTASPQSGPDRLERLRCIRMMHLLERIARRFNEAGVPLMVLKGAALNLTLHHEPGRRPMQDLDLLVRPQDIQHAQSLLEGLGCLRGEGLVREDFFPRFHYEMEYHIGSLCPVKIDLHIRPFRPLRYAHLVPEDGLWQRALTVQFGEATILVPGPENMLIHLAVHWAIHGYERSMWRDDIRQWVRSTTHEIDWELVVETADSWRLALPLREALSRIAVESGPVGPPSVIRKLDGLRVSWRDRLALRQAPRDATHPAAHVITDALCTPSWRFVLAYLLAVCFPDRGHMADWYAPRHPLWLPCAHLLRLMWPVVGRAQRVWSIFSRIRLGKSGIHGTGVFATRDIRPGRVIARYHGKPVEHLTRYVGCYIERDGKVQHYEITGKLKFLNHSCEPNARIEGFRLVALRPIPAGQEITIDYTQGRCQCHRNSRQPTGSAAKRTAEAA